MSDDPFREQLEWQDFGREHMYDWVDRELRRELAAGADLGPPRRDAAPETPAEPVRAAGGEPGRSARGGADMTGGAPLVEPPSPDQVLMDAAREALRRPRTSVVYEEVVL